MSRTYGENGWKYVCAVCGLIQGRFSFYRNCIAGKHAFVYRFVKRPRMFYVFYVNQGYMQPLEVTAALGSVHKLQCAIEDLTRVPMQEQVLLVSGGDGLQPDRPVASYQGAGTDSNPVFLFCKLSKGENRELSNPQENAELNEISSGLYDQLRLLENVTISNALIAHYGDAARNSRHVADIAMQLCARLVQDHQLLHQGWLALVSNLDDSRVQIEKRAEKFNTHFEKLKTMKMKAQAVLQDFDTVLDVLHKIIIPSALLANSSKFEGGTKPGEECTLFEYISCADPQSSLKDMVEQVQHLLSKMDDAEHRQVFTQLKLVNEQISKTELRDIGGINMRLTQLDSHLCSLEQLEKRLKEIVLSVCQGSAHDPGGVKEVVFKQREQMEEVRKVVEELQKTGRAFSLSKIELLNNIRTRLSGWILQAYERLHSVNNLIIIFEEKFIALRNRLDIIRQVKESPVMYATAITETIRRSVLQPEFQSWFTVYMEKSTGLVREETSIRETFTSKLGRHFLKQLFPGLFDPFPDFAPSGVYTFDNNLPPVDHSHLRALRQAVPHLAHLLKVSEPLVFQRLTVRDPHIVSTIQVSGAPVMRREESFFTSDSTINIATLNKNFPSTTWLSGDENLEISPSNAPFLTKSPPSRFSSLSLDTSDASSRPLNPLSPLFDVCHQDGDAAPESSVSQSVKSAPIRIPPRNDSSRQMSEKSSHFSTPEDHFSSSQYRLEMDRPSNQAAACVRPELFEPMKTAVQGLSKETKSLREFLSATASAFGDDMKNAEETLKGVMDAFLKAEDEKLRAQVEKSCEAVRTEYSSRHALVVGELEDQLAEYHAKSKELEELKTHVKEKEAEISELVSLKRNQEATIARLELERDEVFKRLTIEHELEVDRLSTQFDEELKRKDKEIDALKQSLRKTKETRSQSLCEEKTDDTVHRSDEMRAAFEKEYKEERIAELEQLLRNTEHVPVDMPEREASGEVEEITEISEASGQASATSMAQQSVVFNSAPIPLAAHEKGDSEQRKETVEEKEKPEDEDKDSEEDIAAVTVNSAVTQTRIRLKDMRMMITIHDINEACSVLVVWSDVHSSYILFSTSPVMHFVKESCLKRMGVRPDSQISSRRPNWLLATTARLELCQIRKADNRYNLAIGTRFYRVEIEPLPLETSGVRRRRSDE